MPVNPVAENVLGTLGAVCWTAQLIPQIWKSWREKSTEGLSPWLVLLWGIAAVFLGVYVIVQNLNIPLILQPQLFGCLSIVSWVQCLYYGRRISQRKAVAILLLSLSLLGGLEAAMVFALRPSYNSGDRRGVMAFGIISSAIISVALFPQYWEIYKHREVVGISLSFMFVDMMGGVFSDLSLAFKEEFDVVAGVTYTLVIVLDAVVLIAAMILNPRAKRMRQREAEATAEEMRQTTPVASHATT